MKRAYLNRLYSTGSAAEAPSRVIMRNNKNAKDGYVYGRIVDESGGPMPGVNIVVKGTTAGTTTDMDGHYVLEADKDDCVDLYFHRICDAETRVGRKNTIDVVMEPDITELSELVVTGLWRSDKENSAVWHPCVMLPQTVLTVRSNSKGFGRTGCWGAGTKRWSELFI